MFSISTSPKFCHLVQSSLSTKGLNSGLNQFEAYPDRKIDNESPSDRKVNTLTKGDDADNQHFLFFFRCFQGY